MADMSNIVEVKEVTSSREANALMAQGWVLLAPPTTFQGEHETLYIYSLGRPKSND